MIRLFFKLIWLALLLLGSYYIWLATTANAEPAVHGPSAYSSVDVEIWTDAGYEPVYMPGEPLHIYFRAAYDCYITLYEIDAEGNVFLLYPYQPHLSNFVRGGVVYCLNDLLGEYELTALGHHGMSYIGAFASPVVYSTPRWLRPHPCFGFVDVYYAAYYYGRVTYDPFLAMARINARIGRGLNIHITIGCPHYYYYVGGWVHYPVYLHNVYYRNSWYNTYRKTRYLVRDTYEKNRHYSPPRSSLAEKRVRTPKDKSGDSFDTKNGVYRNRTGALKSADSGVRTKDSSRIATDRKANSTDRLEERRLPKVTRKAPTSDRYRPPTVDKRSGQQSHPPAVRSRSGESSRSSAMSGKQRAPNTRSYTAPKRTQKSSSAQKSGVVQKRTNPPRGSASVKQRSSSSRSTAKAKSAPPRSKSSQSSARKKVK